ncbi:winged helix-turn-helix transcriptional regulator [bacterium]|nr:winged helix-turn-helix transcriptional regulator [bacterium]
MNTKEKKLYKMQAQVFKALAHPIRLAAVNFLKDGEQCVCDIIDYVESERSNVSRHLAVLKQVGVVSDRKEGLQVFYRLNMPCAISFFKCVSEIVQDQNEQRVSLLS